MATSDADCEANEADGAGELSGVPAIDRLARLSEKRRLEFSFAVGSMPFHAHLQAAADGIRMRIAGELGALPFTAESPTARRTLAAALRRSPRFDWGGLTVNENNRILVYGEVLVRQPINPLAIVRETSSFILAAYPAISLILDYAYGRPGEARSA